MVTESFQEYKNYIIRLRAATNSGFGLSLLIQIIIPSFMNG